MIKKQFLQKYELLKTQPTLEIEKICNHYKIRNLTKTSIKKAVDKYDFKNLKKKEKDSTSGGFPKKRYRRRLGKYFFCRGIYNI